MAKKITREDYISIIGFFRNTALIDKKLCKEVKRKSFEYLLEQNMLRECICDALYSNDEEKKKRICEHYLREQEQNGAINTVETISQEDYVLQFKDLVYKYGVLENILELAIYKKYV